MPKLLSKQINSGFTEDEHERLRGLAAMRRTPVSALVRKMVLEQLNDGMTRGERLTLSAVRELQQTYLDVLETTVANKGLTLEDIEEINRTNRLRRDALAQQFLNEMETAREEDTDER